MSEFWAVFSLFWSSLLSATLLPSSSEVLLVALLLADSAKPYLLIVVATVGNTLGGLTNIFIGRLLPQPKQQAGYTVAMRWLQRYGCAALLFSWVPVVGDLLCVLAGWLRMPWMQSAVFIGIGKALRYTVLAGITLQGMAWWS
ncbi:membrane protein [Pectobacterium araliae]|uniref:YqaA family protein n=1 Tax=Pectobacterium araliae TaxID=3073862 RepID=A0AAN0MM63_9GAMM|nr:YqaA family protein [Pectobacterium sp. MAFF 302110]GKW22206.1 membrane protein [Pectobacterium carotovorum subsp. carotovorum]